LVSIVGLGATAQEAGPSVQMLETTDLDQKAEQKFEGLIYTKYFIISSSFLRHQIIKPCQKAF